MKGTTKSLGQKDIFDKFYTKPEIAKHCIECLNINNYDLIIEPSAGNGSFSSQIPNCYAIDIQPESKEIIQMDFFKYSNIREEAKKILVIGNPPFGQQSTLALKFFNHAASFADTIAFILPRSFKKSSIQNLLNLNFHLIYEEKLPKNSFLLNNSEYDVPCIFQIWEWKNEIRKKIKLPLTCDFLEFTKNIKEADFRIQRVGGNAGKAFLDKNGAISSNYYVINKSNLTNEQFINLINDLIFPSIEDTVGPKSLPKGELIACINEKLEL